MTGLDELFDICFKDGTGISRDVALQSPRFAELTEEYSTDRLLYPAENPHAAELELLGERLADAAFTKLPRSLRRYAKNWHTFDADQQLSALSAVVTQLTSAQWRKLHPSLKDDQIVDGIGSFLPEAFGSWSGGTVRPICLGLAHMLIGFARATGADHMSVHVLRAQDKNYFSTRLLYEQQILDSLAPHAKRSRVIRRLRDGVRESYAYTAASLTKLTHQEAHHALAIRTAKGWYIVDSYMGSMLYRLPGRTRDYDRAYRRLKRQPDRSINLTLPNEAFATAERLSLQMQVTAQHITKLRQANAGAGPSINDLIGLAAHSVFRNHAAISTDETPESVSEKYQRLMATEKFSSEISTLLTVAAIPSIVAGMQARGTWKGNAERLSQYGDRLFTSQAARTQAMYRILHMAALKLAYELDNASTAPLNRRHAVVELAHPTYPMGVFTLNNASGHLAAPQPGLIATTSCQWITHDTMAAVREEGTPAQRTILDTRLQTLSRFPHKVSVLPGLRPHVPSTRG